MTQNTKPTQATSDANGKATFRFEPPPQGWVLTGSLSIPTAPSGATFQATAADVFWGAWSGPAQHSPVQINEAVPLIVQAAGLLPNTVYVAMLTGTQQPAGTEPAVWPSTTLTTPFVAQTLQDANVTIGASQTQQFGPFPTQGFSSLRLTINNPDNTLTYQVALTWSDLAGNTSGDQTFLIGGNQGSIAQLQQPHKGDFVTVQIVNNGGHAGAPFVYLANTTETAAYWVGDAFTEGDAWESIPVGAGATSTLLTPSHIFGGPAQLFINAGGAATWHATIHATLLTGVDAQLYRFQNTDPAFTSGEGTVPLIVPAAPIHVDFTNATGGPVTPVLGLYFDAWRVG